MLMRSKDIMYDILSFVDFIACLVLAFLKIDMMKAFYSSIQTLCHPLFTRLSFVLFFFHIPLLESK